MSVRLSYKIAVVGDGAVGKSSMVQRLVTGSFLTDMKITIGTDVFTYFFEIEDNSIKLQIWDFAGEDRFRSFLPNYCKGAVGCLLCYDITRYQSFKNLNEWLSIIEENTSNPIIVLVGMKLDLADEKRVVELSNAEEYKQKQNIEYFFETSSKSGFNNKKIFKTLTQAIMDKNS